MSLEEGQKEVETNDQQGSSGRNGDGLKGGDSVALSTQRRKQPRYAPSKDIRLIQDANEACSNTANQKSFEEKVARVNDAGDGFNLQPKTKRIRLNMREVSLSVATNPNLPTLIVDQSGPVEQWRKIIKNVLEFPSEYIILCSGCSRQTECTMLTGGIVRCTRCGKATPIRPAEDQYRWILFKSCDQFNQIRNGMRITACPICTDSHCLVLEADSAVRLPKKKDCSRESSASPPSPEFSRNPEFPRHRKPFSEGPSMSGLPPFAPQGLPMNSSMNLPQMPNQYGMHQNGQDRNNPMMASMGCVPRF